MIARALWVLPVGAALLSAAPPACRQTPSASPSLSRGRAVPEASNLDVTKDDASDGAAPFEGSVVVARGRDAGRLDADTADVAPRSLDATRPVASVAWVPFAPGRSSFVVKRTTASPAPQRLLAMLHGVCTPPSYVCGAWKEAAADHGLLVCPTGNATCGPNGTGAPTWEESFSAMDADLEAAIGAVRRRPQLAASRDGEVLLGFSRGAYVAVILAVRHPGRWPFLILNEADVDLTVPMLRGAGVRAVALVGGEWGTQVAGQRKTVEALVRQGYPARLWIMPKVGHAYSPDIDSIMREALDFVLSHEHDAELH